MAIYDADVAYATRFMEYIKKRNNVGLEVTVFTRKDSLTDFVKYQAIELLLLGEGLSPEELPKENIRHIIKLSEERELSQASEIPTIYKYQSSQKVVSKLLECYARLENPSVSVHSNELTIISVFTPASNLSERLYAEYLANVLAERKRVLFLPLELFPVPSTDSSVSSDHFQSEFIYYLKENNPNLILKMKSLLNYSGRLNFISGLTHSFDLLSLNKQEAVKFIDELRLKSDYEVVVFYLGFYSDFTAETMKLSDCIEVVTREGIYTSKVLSEWERQMELLDISPAQSKFRKILLPLGETLDSMAGIRQEQFGNELLQLARQRAESL
ncbi:MAG TPA: hypothetical protein VJZ06_00740 [Mobilitalea sp.]|nr:hypothetical protein [Mobilitalea sp.]